MLLQHVVERLFVGKSTRLVACKSVLLVHIKSNLLTAFVWVSKCGPEGFLFGNFKTDSLDKHLNNESRMYKGPESGNCFRTPQIESAWGEHNMVRLTVQLQEY